MIYLCIVQLEGCCEITILGMYALNLEKCRNVERQLVLLAKYDAAVLTEAWVRLSALYCNTF